MEINKISQLITVSPHAKVCDIEAKLNREAYTLGYHPIKGTNLRLDQCLSERMINLFHTKYGFLEDLLVGGSFLTPMGRQIRLLKSSSTTTGIDYRKLIIGGENLFGKFIEVQLKIFPLPDKIQWGLLRCGLVHQAEEFYRFLCDQHIKPYFISLFDENIATELGLPLNEPLADDHLVVLKLGGLSSQILAEKQVMVDFIQAWKMEALWVDTGPLLLELDEKLIHTDTYLQWRRHFGSFMGRVARSKQTDQAFRDYFLGGIV